MGGEQGLLSSYRAGSLTLRNRVVMAPLTRCRATDDRVPTPMMAEYYGQRASAGLIVSEATVVTPDGVGYLNTPGIYNAAQVAGWKAVTKAVHDRGGLIFCQTWHCGRSSHSELLGGKLPVSASAIKIDGDGVHTATGKKPYETPRALETAEIPGIVELFRRGALLAKEAGFDGVEIHSANGYLLDQFLQSLINHRTDAYGGSVANRFRFLREVVEATVSVWGANLVGVRLSPNGVFNGMGSPDYRETFGYAASELSRYGLAYLHVLDGTGFGMHPHGTPMTLDDLRLVFKGTLMGNCGYNRETAEAAIREGRADLIAFGRPYITNPDLVERFVGNHPLAPDSEMSTWYAGGAKGYTDYPTFAAAGA
jgi:N-ethylmaleimide reductase